MDVRITVIFNIFEHEGLKGEKGLTEGKKKMLLLMGNKYVYWRKGERRDLGREKF